MPASHFFGGAAPLNNYEFEVFCVTIVWGGGWTTKQKNIFVFVICIYDRKIHVFFVNQDSMVS